VRKISTGLRGLGVLPFMLKNKKRKEGFPWKNRGSEGGGYSRHPGLLALWPTNNILGDELVCRQTRLWWHCLTRRPVGIIIRLSAVGYSKLYSKALEYEYRVKTAALGTLKRYSILSLTLYLE
jgi:hypothetical protein